MQCRQISLYSFVPYSSADSRQGWVICLEKCRLQQSFSRTGNIYILLWAHLNPSCPFYPTPGKAPAVLQGKITVQGTPASSFHSCSLTFPCELGGPWCFCPAKSSPNLWQCFVDVKETKESASFLQGCVAYELQAKEQQVPTLLQSDMLDFKHRHNVSHLQITE